LCSAGDDAVKEKLLCAEYIQFKLAVLRSSSLKDEGYSSLIARFSKTGKLRLLGTFAGLSAVKLYMTGRIVSCTEATWMRIAAPAEITIGDANVDGDGRCVVDEARAEESERAGLADGVKSEFRLVPDPGAMSPTSMKFCAATDASELVYPTPQTSLCLGEHCFFRSH
jgi:hypothetical protein